MSLASLPHRIGGKEFFLYRLLHLAVGAEGESLSVSAILGGEAPGSRQILLYCCYHIPRNPPLPTRSLQLFEKELTSSAKTAFRLLATCLNFSELKNHFLQNLIRFSIIFYKMFEIITDTFVLLEFKGTTFVGLGHLSLIYALCVNAEYFLMGLKLFSITLLLDRLRIDELGRAKDKSTGTLQKYSSIKSQGASIARFLPNGVLQSKAPLTSFGDQESSTQMAGKLIFSMDRDLIVEGITSGSGVNSPISEMEAVVTPLTTVSSTEEDNNQKLITTGELPSQSEIESSSGIPVASKNKRKNYLRRVRKKVVKARKTAEVKALKYVKSKTNKQFVAPSTYPFPDGNHFHPSPFAQRKEVVEMSTRSSIHLLDYYMARINQAKTEQTPALGLRPLVEGFFRSLGLNVLVVDDALRGTTLALSRLRIDELGRAKDKPPLDKALPLILTAALSLSPILGAARAGRFYTRMHDILTPPSLFAFLRDTDGVDWRIEPRSINRLIGPEASSHELWYKRKVRHGMGTGLTLRDKIDLDQEWDLD
ncbi:hypothetical protein IEQ34_015201 [Dendrobium chrysotoxum]|uniref:Uncharacterized protein n=1 Tax=Dendrobium chrysotoxum TaxID=161865 RepID=A0AAV7GH40_DENCH|nr:hypothetical protein IEQ34_015201 [Dendrobium chrysotoxum]